MYTRLGTLAIGDPWDFPMQEQRAKGMPFSSLPCQADKHVRFVPRGVLAMPTYPLLRFRSEITPQKHQVDMARC